MRRTLPARRSGRPARGGYRGGPVEIDRVAAPSGNMEALDKQFWLGTPRAGMVVTFWSLPLPPWRSHGPHAHGI
jgi:hypothetical protein